MTIPIQPINLKKPMRLMLPTKPNIMSTGGINLAHSANGWKCIKSILRNAVANVSDRTYVIL